MKEIELTQGYRAQVDDEDFARLSKFKWYPQIKRRKDGSISSLYAIRTARVRAGRWKTHAMHCDILGTSSGVDHKDTNGLNNQKENLRLAGKRQNGFNRRLGATNTSGFKGVHWSERAKRWKAQINIDKKRISIGYFKLAADAARAYDEAALAHYGEFALTNKMMGLLKLGL